MIAGRLDQTCQELVGGDPSIAFDDDMAEAFLHDIGAFGSEIFPLGRDLLDEGFEVFVFVQIGQNFALAGKGRLRDDARIAIVECNVIKRHAVVLSRT